MNTLLPRNDIMPSKPSGVTVAMRLPQILEELNGVVSAPKYFIKYQYLCNQNIRSPKF